MKRSGLVLVRSRGVPSRRQWRPPSFAEVEVLRQVARSHGVEPVRLVQALTIHRTRIALERQPDAKRGH